MELSRQLGALGAELDPPGAKRGIGRLVEGEAGCLQPQAQSGSQVGRPAVDGHSEAGPARHGV